MSDTHTNTHKHTHAHKHTHKVVQYLGKTVLLVICNIQRGAIAGNVKSRFLQRVRISNPEAPLHIYYLVQCKKKLHINNNYSAQSSIVRILRFRRRSELVSFPSQSMTP